MMEVMKGMDGMDGMGGGGGKKRRGASGTIVFKIGPSWI